MIYKEETRRWKQTGEERGGGGDEEVR